MKRSMFIAAGCMISLAACAHKLKESELPAAVQSAFKKDHANTKEVKWEKEGADYEAEFESGETEQSMLYSASGQLLETEVEIKTEELPAAVRTYLAQNYKDAKIKETARITDAKGNQSYEVEIKGKDLIFDTNGKLIKEVPGSDKETH